MIETKAGAAARRDLRADMELRGYSDARMAAILGVRESKLTEWLGGTANYPIELKVRKYLGVATPNAPEVAAPKGEPKHEGRDVLIESLGASGGTIASLSDIAPARVKSEIDAAVTTFARSRGNFPFEYRVVVRNTETKETILQYEREWVAPAFRAPQPPATNGHVEPAPEPEPATVADDADDFAFFNRGSVNGSIWTEPGIRILKSKGKISFSKALKDLLGGATHIQIGYRAKDGAILLRPAASDGRADVFRLGAGGEFSSQDAVAWMLEHGYERGKRYTAVAEHGGAVVRP